MSSELLSCTRILTAYPPPMDGAPSNDSEPSPILDEKRRKKNEGTYEPWPESADILNRDQTDKEGDGEYPKERKSPI